MGTGYDVLVEDGIHDKKPCDGMNTFRYLYLGKDSVP
jgi:hypothetical protein